MKKIFATIMGICMLGACCITGCGENEPPVNENPGGDPTIEQPGTQGPETPETPETPEAKPTDDSIQTDRASLDFAFEGLYKQNTFIDAAAGFNSAKDVTGGRFFVNGKYYDKFSSVGSRQDVKLELYNEGHAMMINVSAGMAFALPSANVKVDYTLAQYRTQYEFDDAVLTFSAEDKNPYEKDAWYIYVNEWAIRHLVNMDYYTNQNLTLLNEDDLGFDITPVVNGTSDGTRSYPTVRNGDCTTRPGYEIYRFDIQINDPGEIERPFYHIGIIHQENDINRAGFFVLKAKENKADVMDGIMKSWRLIGAKGKTRNYFENKDPVEDPHWNEETRNFFRQFSTQTTKSWGVFSYSMPGDSGSLHSGSSDYDLYLTKSRTVQEYIENEVWGGKKYDVYMTYTHLGRGNNYAQVSKAHHYFPTDMAKALAGGNGDGTKPVLEFTFQFTTNNNLVDQEITPLFDILRGKYDNYFQRLARDIKEYGAPIMFRLNNEMNTDWTSYSGIMNLLDPDIFTATWKRLYNVFIANGVDNVIWVWNPIADSAPYSGWGEDLCYFPGFDYVQLLGGTSYEFNNYTGDAMTQYISFKEHYGKLYEKNKTYFEKWSMIIGEFACGSGGAVSGELGRNRAAQAAYVRGMFEELNSENPAPYVKQIKGLIWFNCNDYVGDRISNRLKFADGGLGDRNESYDDLAETWAAFRTGFANAAK